MSNVIDRELKQIEKDFGEAGETQLLTCVRAMVQIQIR